MNIKIKDKNGVLLKTKGKYVKEDISVAVDESILGVTPTGTYEVVENGEYDITEYAKVNVNVPTGGSGGDRLKKLLDCTQTTSHMFFGNQSSDLSEYISYSDTENVKVMSAMFRGCSNLKEIPNLNTDQVYDMSEMFYGCAGLTSIKLKTNKVINFSQMFGRCEKLGKIDITFFTSTATIYSDYMFRHCYSLYRIIIRGFGETYYLNYNSFENCHCLNGTKHSTYNPTGAKYGYIYVPRSMVDTLKSATNWSVYADQIRALEDYTVDGTTTGELDKSKI